MNHPLWAKAVEVMYPKANLMSKKQYWGVSYPLTVTILCVAPREFFLRHWLQFVEAHASKLRVSNSKSSYSRAEVEQNARISH